MDHVHYDLAALENQMMAEFGATKPVDEFHRHQLMGTEAVIKFGVCLARFENEGLTAEQQALAGASIIASMLQNLAESFDGEAEANLMAVLARVAEFALQGGESAAVVHFQPMAGGRA